MDLAREATGPERGGIERVEPVRCADDDDPVVPPEAVHLDEQLVERLLALLVAVVPAAGLGHRVDLVDEDHGTAGGPGLGEQLSDPAGATPTYFSTNSEPETE